MTVPHYVNENKSDIRGIKLRTFRPKNTFFAVLRQKLSWGERQG